VLPLPVIALAQGVAVAALIAFLELLMCMFARRVRPRAEARTLGGVVITIPMLPAIWAVVTAMLICLVAFRVSASRIVPRVESRPMLMAVAIGDFSLRAGAKD
jgi:mannose/fructose/N-acetylgalactosamine-specific phosphotransferase system component IIC